MRKLGIVAALAAAAAWFFDPASGRRRRAELRDRIAGFFRRSIAQTTRAGRGLSADTYGLVKKATHLREEPKDFDDATLKNKVETELFRPADAPKGQVSINVQEGVVQLRGALDSSDLIDDLVKRTRSIQGVRDVENLLHLSGTPAPMHQ
jgi:hypothetical protein